MGRRNLEALAPPRGTLIRSVTAESLMDERSFLSRWSRRKALRQEELDDEVLGGTEETVTKTVDSAEESPPSPTDEDMPAVESLGADDNYGDFLSPKVSEKLRKVALRKLFHGAGFNIRDGLDDYDEDFTYFEPLGDIVTADMRHREEMLERKAREAAQAADKESASEQQVATQAQTELEEESEVPDSETDDLADTEIGKNEDVVVDDAEDEKSGMTDLDRPVDRQVPDPGSVSDSQIARMRDDTKGENG